MNATVRARSGYRAQADTLRSARDLEYDALAMITGRLETAADPDAAGGGAADIGARAAALHDNRRLWALFATEAADPANPLPADLRARIRALGAFTQAHTSKVLRDGAPLGPLIEINTAVMRGLSGARGCQ